MDAFTIRLTSVPEELTGLHPDTPLELIPTDARVDLAAGATVVAFPGGGRRIDDPSLIRRRIRVIGMSVLASRSRAAERPLAASEAQFAGHRFILRNGISRVWSAGVWLAARFAPDQIAARCRGLTGVEATVLLGWGIGWLPSRTSQQGGRRIKCYDLPVEGAPTVWLLIGPAACRRPEVTTFAAFFVPRYRAQFEPT